MAYGFWPRTKKSLPTSVQREFRGVNRLDPLTIDDRFASDMVNVTSIDFPVMKTRPGYTNDTTLPGRVNGISSRIGSELVAVSNTDLYVKNTSWTNVGGTFDANADVSFANFQGGFTTMNVLMANGINPMHRWDGTSLSNVSGAPSTPDFVESFQDRVWCVTTQNNVKNQLNFSEYRVATNWTTINEDDTDPGFIVVEDNRGEPINGLHAGNSHLTIFKPNSIYELYGYTPQDFRLINVTHEVGIVCNKAWVTAKGVQYFIHTTGIYQYSGGTLPSEDFSRPVQDYVNRMNLDAKTKCVCWTDGVMVWFAMPIDGATECNIVLEYNTEFDIWCVWNGYAPTHATSIVQSVYVGNTDGTVRLIGGSTDNGSSISGYWTTKVFGGSSFAQVLRWKRSWVTADVPAGSALQVYMSPNPDRTNEFQLVQNVPNSVGLRSSRVIIPVPAAYYSDFIAQRFSFSGPVIIKEWAREEVYLPIV